VLYTAINRQLFSSLVRTHIHWSCVWQSWTYCSRKP